MPRRKYGRMIKPLPVTKPEKCRFCKTGRPCPVHPVGLGSATARAKKR